MAMQNCNLGCCLCSRELWNVQLPNCTSSWFFKFCQPQLQIMFVSVGDNSKVPRKSFTDPSRVFDAVYLESDANSLRFSIRLKQSGDHACRVAILNCVHKSIGPEITWQQFFGEFCHEITFAAWCSHQWATWSVQERVVEWGCVMTNGTLVVLQHGSSSLAFFVQKWPKPSLASLLTSINGFGRRVLFFCDLKTSLGASLRSGPLRSKNAAFCVCVLKPTKDLSVLSVLFGPKLGEADFQALRFQGAASKFLGIQSSYRYRLEGVFDFFFWPPWSMWFPWKNKPTHLHWWFFPRKMFQGDSVLAREFLFHEFEPKSTIELGGWTRPEDK